ncbi:MAG: HAMP domain-containing sensor histidine kinase [Acidimicrobiales bacterium]
MVFGVATSGLYARSLANQLDDQLQANARGQAARLMAVASQDVIDPETCAPVGDATGSDGPFGGGPGPAPGQGLDAYAELRTADGAVVACSDPVTADGRPEIPDDLQIAASGRTTFDTGSAEGSGSWRVLALTGDDLPIPRFSPGGAPGVDPSEPTVPGAPTTTAPTEAITFADGSTSDGAVILVAVRTDGVDASLAKLQRIELIAGIALLVALASGSWLVLRRGLRPLEEMAGTATTINAGDLSRRVDAGDDRTEVGQLGRALNSMLDGIEGSFREREATEAKLRQFLADASHELRTPLTSIQGYAELFRLAGAEPAAAPTTGTPGATPTLDLPVVMARIEQEATRMRGLVEDLLLLARLDEPSRSTDPGEVPPEQVDLALAAAEACTSVAGMAGDHPITLDAPDPVLVPGIAAHLHRAVTNLVANAIKHTPPGTAIEVTVAANPITRRSSVTVRDHGPGLDDEALAHAFDRFWQADAARVGVGSGLGLSIVAGIAEEHGGTATAANAPDGGAVFTIELPPAPAAEVSPS